MSELRQDLANKEWVVIAPERGQKPNALKAKIITNPVAKNSYEAGCPFCPGNEEKFSLVEKQRMEDGEGNWVVKVIDNKYKLLDNFATCPLVPGSFEREGIYNLGNFHDRMQRPKNYNIKHDKKEAIHRFSFIQFNWVD